MNPGVGIRRRDLAAVASISAVQLGLELTFIKLTRYELGAFSFGVIGLALLGVALAAPLTRWLGGPIPAATRASVAVPVAALVAGAVLFSRAHDFTDGGSAARSAGAMALVCLVVLALSSVPVYATMQRVEGSVYSVYAASLAGAAVGAPLAFGLLHGLGDGPAYAVLVATSVVPAALLAPGGSGRASALVVGSAAAVGASFALPRIDRAAHPDSIFIQTNAFSRIDVNRFDSGALRFRTAGINAGTTWEPGPVRSPRRKNRRLRSLPLQLRPGQALILGAGAGSNAVDALAHGAKQVVAIEINPMIPAYLEAAVPPAENPYRDPSIELLVGEGRDLAAGICAEGGRRFDLVFIPIATLFGTSGRAFTQTYLMTREAFVQYAHCLTQDGALAVYSPAPLRRKVAGAMLAALGDVGVASPGEHLEVFEQENRFVAVARPSRPFDAAELERLDYHRRNDVRLPNAPDRHESVRGLTDDNPFLYDAPTASRGARKLWGYTPRLTTLSYAVAAILTLGVLVLGLRRARARRERSGLLAAFATMGIAFVVFQTALIQRLAFLVGHPLTATAVVLPATLLGTSLGSAFSRRYLVPHSPRVRLGLTAALVAIVIGYAFAAPHLLLLPGWHPAARAALAAVVAIPPFFCMGTFFPVAFALAEKSDPDSRLWCWVINGAASVLGSTLVLSLALRLGFQATFFLAAALYAALGIWDAVARSPRRRVADVALVTALALVFAGGVVAST